MPAETRLLPGESSIDSIRIGGGEVVLTDRRVLFLGETSDLGAEYALVRGNVRAAAPLTGFDSVVMGTGKRPWLLLSSLSLAVAAAVMFMVPPARYAGLVCASACVLFFLTWLAWSRTFLAINLNRLKITGAVNKKEAVVFVERLELAAMAARAGAGPAEVKAAACEPGKPELISG